MKILNICLITIIYSMANVGLSQRIQIPGTYHWENRILLLFSSNQDDKHQQQINIFNENQSGFKERDLVVFYINENKVVSPDNNMYGKEEVERLRKQYQVGNNDFSVILIGKDGTQKLQQNDVLSADKLFAVIDAMPMRRREMREGGKN